MSEVGTMNAATKTRTLIAALALLGAAACNEDRAEGEVLVSAYGESFIEDGIPADAMEDGWAVRFDRFEVEIEGVTVAGSDVEVASPVDLTPSTDGEGQAIGSAFVPGGDHGGASFTLARIEVAGQAEKDREAIRFDWVFDMPTRYEECDTTTTVVGADGPARFEITVHADHLFYDSLVSEEPALRFQALADADADGDGEITRGELAAADLGAYDPGSSGDIEDLWSFVEAQARTLGHVDGEGHCHVHGD